MLLFPSRALIAVPLIIVDYVSRVYSSIRAHSARLTSAVCSRVLLLRLSSVYSRSITVRAVHSRTLGFLGSMFKLRSSVDIVRRRSRCPTVDRLRMNLTVRLRGVGPSLSDALGLRYSGAMVRLIGTSSPLSSSYLPGDLQGT